MTIYAQDQNPTTNITCGLGLNITNANLVSDSLGDAVVLGKIINNNQTATFYGPGVVAEIYDSQNNLIGVESTDAEIGSVSPNSSTPFKLATDVRNETLDRMSLTCLWDDYEITKSALVQPEGNQSSQVTNSNLTADLYNQCTEIAGKDTCNFMFQR